MSAQVVARSDPPDYLSYEDAVRPKLEALVANDGAKAMDRANAVRFLRCLDYILSDDPRRVQLLFAREWHVKKKLYRVTWSTGAFIQQLAERYYTITGDDAVKPRRPRSAAKRTASSSGGVAR